MAATTMLNAVSAALSVVSARTADLLQSLPHTAVAIPGSGTGLVGLAERTALSGGHLEHGLDERGDFQLRAWLPWPQ